MVKNLNMAVRKLTKGYEYRMANNYSTPIRPDELFRSVNSTIANP